MPINVSNNFIGTPGQAPSRVQAWTTDSLDVVSEPGYLNRNSPGFQVDTTQIWDITTNYSSPMETSYSYQVSIDANKIITLTSYNIGASGGVTKNIGGAGITVSPAGGTGDVTITNTGVLGVTSGGAGISVTGAPTAPVINNTGITSVVGSAYIGASTVSGAATITNNGVRTCNSGTGITVNNADPNNPVFNYTGSTGLTANPSITNHEVVVAVSGTQVKSLGTAANGQLLVGAGASNDPAWYTINNVASDGNWPIPFTTGGNTTTVNGINFVTGAGTLTAGSPKIVTVTTLTNAQVVALNNTTGAFQLVAAPGANKIIFPTACMIFYKIVAGTNWVWNGGANPSLSIRYATNNLPVFANVTQAVTDPAGTYGWVIAQPQFNAAIFYNQGVNEGLEVAQTAGTVAGGNAANIITFVIEYMIVNTA